MNSQIDFASGVLNLIRAQRDFLDSQLPAYVRLVHAVARDQMKNVPVLGRAIRGMSIFFDLGQLD